MNNPKIVTPLDLDPMISLEECRLHLRVTPDSNNTHPDDTLILALLGAAREWVEGETGLSLSPRTLELALDDFPFDDDGIPLPQPPIASVTSVHYVDADGVSQSMAIATDVVLDDYQWPAWLLPASGTAWPETRAVVNAVTVRYAAGYSLTTEPAPQARPLPKTLRAAVLLLLGALYENREDSAPVQMHNVPFGVKALCTWQKIRLGLA